MGHCPNCVILELICQDFLAEQREQWSFLSSILVHWFWAALLVLGCAMACYYRCSPYLGEPQLGEALTRIGMGNGPSLKLGRGGEGNQSRELLPLPCATWRQSAVSTVTWGNDCWVALYCPSSSLSSSVINSLTSPSFSFLSFLHQPSLSTVTDYRSWKENVLATLLFVMFAPSSVSLVYFMCHVLGAHMLVQPVVAEVRDGTSSCFSYLAHQSQVPHENIICALRRRSEDEIDENWTERMKNNSFHRNSCKL